MTGTVLSYVPIAVLVAVISGFAGIALAFVKVIPKLKELSTKRLMDAVEAWQRVAERHEARLQIVEDEGDKLRTQLRECEAICRNEAAARADSDVAHDVQIENLHREFAEVLRTTKELLGGRK
jgi:Skp family chaperone for outer membrane proteins